MTRRRRVVGSIHPMTKRGRKLATLINEARKHVDGIVCGYCGTAVDKRTASIDHIIPASKDGSNEVCNLVLACVACNKSKGNQSWNIWYGPREGSGGATKAELKRMRESRRSRKRNGAESTGWELT